MEAKSQVPEAGVMTWRPDYSEDPHPLCAGRQVAGPVRRGVLDGLPVWLVSGYDNVRRLMADPRASSDACHAGPAARAVQADDPHPLLRSMTRLDPPGHTRLRKLAARAFTARRVQALQPRIQQVTGQLIAAMLPAGRADLVGDFALPLPIAVITDLLGVPDQGRPEFLYWAGICAGVSEGDPGRRQQALIQMSGFLDMLIESKSSQRGGGAGEGDLLDGLITARDEGDRLSHDELLAMAFLLLAAGYETTASLIGNGVLALLHHPDQMAALRADPARAGAAVEEFLRYDGPLKIAPRLRFTTTDIPVAGTVIPAGETVLIFLSAASRDPARFPRPDMLDIGRDATGHLAFGHGVHYCPGAPLARLQAQIAVTALITRLDKLALAPGTLSWRHSYALHSLKSLPVTFTPAATDPAGVIPSAPPWCPAGTGGRGMST